ncbi:MAG: LUD domain-containing protein [Immundisolibacterales bacterium]|nr:LUD domain-containing protein [Immundisolibacterales bacterium]
MTTGSGGAPSGARARVLDAVRAAVRREPAEAEAEAAARREEIEARIAAHEVHVRPSVEGDLAMRFAEKVTLVSASFAPVPGIDGVSRAVANYLEEHGLEKEIVVTTDPLVERVRWSNEFAVARRAAEPEDRVSVTGAYAGIAETGTVVFVSDRTTPTTLNFLPETHVAVLARDRLVAHLEDVWARLREERAAPPRTVNFITGPSRTGDIELQLELGAHGPRRLHVLLVDA